MSNWEAYVLEHEHFLNMNMALVALEEYVI